MASTTIPTAADLLAGTAPDEEIYGLRTAKTSTETDFTAPDIFIHGRDYSLMQSASPHYSLAQDNAQFVRTYRLFADNTFDSGTKAWTGRANFVSGPRLRLFMASLVGYPYVMSGNDGKKQLFRHLPEPFKFGSDGNDYTWSDTRDPSSPVDRFELHATRVVSVSGEGPGGNRDKISGALWTPLSKSAIYNFTTPSQIPYPSEMYQEYVIQVAFERLPYNVMRKTDADFAGEYSRFVVYQEDPVGRALQVRGGVQWQTTDGYGQPVAGDRIAGVFSSKEGAPRLVGENNLTWKWMDVPPAAVNWSVYRNDGSGGTYQSGIKATFGDLNVNDEFTRPGRVNGYAPFMYFAQESLLFRTASRTPDRPCPWGMPVNDYTLFFQHSPAEDGMGYWNRILNTKGKYQRYGLPSRTFYLLQDFNLLFKTADYW